MTTEELEKFADILNRIAAEEDQLEVEENQVDEIIISDDDYSLLMDFVREHSTEE